MDRPENQRIHPGDARRGEIEIVRETEAAAGETVRFYKDLVRTLSPSGELVESHQTRLRRAAGHDDGVVVVPIDPDDRILLIRQFRHATRMWMRELPRGGREQNESIEDAARREVREEIGYDVDRLVPLGRIAGDGAMFESVPHILAARVRAQGKPRRESTEAIDRIIPYRMSELVAACHRGEVIDGYTVGAALLLQPYFDGDRFSG